MGRRPHDDRLRQVLADARAAASPCAPSTPTGCAGWRRAACIRGSSPRSRALPAASLEELAGPADGPPLIVVLDGVEDPQNVGAILRSLDAAGGSGLVRQTRHAAPLDGAAAKASAGAVHHVPVADVVNIARAVEELKSAGSGRWDSTPTPKPLR